MVVIGWLFLVGVIIGQVYFNIDLRISIGCSAGYFGVIVAFGKNKLSQIVLFFSKLN
jgi:hypothetical protein